MPSPGQPIMLTLESTDAAIILKNDGTCEVSLPETHQEPLPENIILGAALAYALQDEILCGLIHDHFHKKCASIPLNEKVRSVS
ncbi:MAG: hypothetical protein J0G29_00095 [Alphaproteobacteria bacterium]|nr:hypothetical protein [Alphaproteobacteria bacterium]OJV47595.1 MAG: hypothetical protein BGO28_07120 [Alphaproteobacteria bacterium 43-37]